MLLGCMPQGYGRLCRSGESKHCDFVLGHTGKKPLQSVRINRMHLWQL